MHFKSLGHFVQELDRLGMLIRIKSFVDPVLEISEVTDRICKQNDGGKAILFENTGTQFPVLTNAFGSDQRLALALGGKDPATIADGIDTLFKLFASPKQGLLDKLKLLPHLRSISQWMPSKSSRRGECQQVVHSTPDLNILPILKTWPHDGGRFVTLPMVNTLDPITGIRNVGMYRMQQLSSNSTGMHWHIHKTGARHYQQYRKLGQRMPIAVALGGDPAYTYAATAPLPDNIDEYILAGFLRNKQVKLVKCITNNIWVPSDADIIIEGYVDPQEDLVWEGPFGDHTGFYSLPDWYPKFHVTCITHRRNAIYPATLVGVPPMEDAFLAKATERIFLSPIKLTLAQEVEDMHLPNEGVAHNITIASINKSFPGQAYKVANALWGAGQMMFNKIMVVLDADVKLTNYLDVARRISERCNPATDIYISKGPLDVLDHASDRVGFGGKVLLDATSILENEPRLQLDTEGVQANQILKVLKNLPKGVQEVSVGLMEQGVSAIALKIIKQEQDNPRRIAEALAEQLGELLPSFILMVDPTVDCSDLAMLCWYISANTDPSRDCLMVKNKLRTALAVDGTAKISAYDSFQRPWPNVVATDPDTIASIDTKWPSLGVGSFIGSPSHKYEEIAIGSSAFAKEVDGK